MFPQAQSIVTLAVANDGDTKLFVVEGPREVVTLRHQAARDGDMVVLQRVRGDKVVTFATQPSNVMNVEANA